MKTQFVCVKPKTWEAKVYFEDMMHSLHSCRIKDKNGTKMFVESLNKNYVFWIDEKEDKNWEIIK